MAETTPQVIADGRCHCARCEARTTSIYRMVGVCLNCGVAALMIYRAGDRAGALTCPRCEVWGALKSQRLATPDEIPVEVADG